MNPPPGFKPRWLARAPRRSIVELASARTRPGLWVGDADEARYWFTGEGPFRELTPEVRQLLRRVADLELFEVRDNNNIAIVDKLVPVADVPTVTWRTLADEIDVSVAAPRFAPARAAAVSLQLVRSHHVSHPTGWYGPWEIWEAYAITAPRIRLDRLEFATSSEGRVVVLGTPLPTLPGTQLVESAGVLIAAGWTWSPPLDPPLVRQILGLADGERALWLANSTSWERLSAEAFVPARRESVRQTGRKLRQGEGGS